MEAVPAPSSAMVKGSGEEKAWGGRGAGGGEELAEDVVGVGGEEGALGAGEVVLGELGDLLEELGAALVVEEPGGRVFCGLAVSPARASCRTASLGETGVAVVKRGLVGLRGRVRSCFGLGCGVGVGGSGLCGRGGLRGVRGWGSRAWRRTGRGRDGGLGKTNNGKGLCGGLPLHFAQGQDDGENWQRQRQRQKKKQIPGGNDRKKGKGKRKNKADPYGMTAREANTRATTTTGVLRFAQGTTNDEQR